MPTAKLFMNGKSQAVRLPKEFRFPGREVIVKAFGDGVLLLPREASWDEWFARLADFPADFMAIHEQPAGRDTREELSGAAPSRPPACSPPGHRAAGSRRQARPRPGRGQRRSHTPASG
ncbi:MAG: Antitoxin VapB [Lentisphaerae bacterium ADurb.BinA184]|nr:MAG: Antitoxin VapB [Lentisphaerae bacterium ADurb.BinA184]